MIDVESVFSPDGELGQLLPSYSFRSGQVEMASLIAKALDERRHAEVEAGTGTGKSFAYLVPVFLSFEENSSRRFVIATSTITLQKQLYDKDIPLIKEALSSDAVVSVLYGRNNYLCLRRFSEARNEKSLLKELRSSSEKAFEEWVASTDTGAAADVPSPEIGRMFYDFVSDDKECMGHRCPYLSQCFYYEARRKAARSNIIVTNHHLLLIDAKARFDDEIDYSDDAILPAYSVCVMDEAHHIENEATDVMSEVYSSYRVLRTLDYLTRKEKRFGSASIIDFLSTEEKERGSGKKAKDDIAHLRTLISDYDITLTELLSRYGKDNEVLFTPAFYRDNLREIEKGEAAAELMSSIAAAIYQGYSDKPSESNDIYVDLIKRYAHTLSHYADTLRTWMRFSRWDEYIPYSEEAPDGKPELHIAPMSTGPVLSKALVSHLDSMIYSSATLTVSSSFSYFENRSGLAEETGRALSGIFPSPFEYRKNLLLLLPQDATLFSNELSEEYTAYVARAVKAAIEASGGGALVLFTSKKMMKDVYFPLRNEMDGLMLQDDKVSKAQLLAEFRKKKDSSLFAVSSFWEGVDAPGDTLRLVIIVKLPFTVPSTPIVKARSEYLLKNEKSPFMEMTMPEATLKLKQGIGRLIRTETDRGVVLLLDGRILRKGYGRLMISSLPDCYIPEDTILDNIGDKIERFLY